MNATEVELIISVVTIAAAWMIGNKSVWGQRLGMVANLCWWYYVIAFERWGLLPMEAMFTVIQVRNLIKWEKESRMEIDKSK